MEVTLNVPPSTVRKIRALNFLVDGKLGASLEESLVALVDRAVAAEIVHQLDLEGSSDQSETLDVGGVDYEVTHRPQAQRRAAARAVVDSDVTGISDGLGDRDEDEEETGPAAAGVTEAELERDMDVDDPEHEQKAEAPTFADQMGATTAEEVFAHVGEYPGVPLVDARAARRKRKVKIRGKVSAFDGAEESTI